MSERNDADVLIVGAGPVGLTLAIDLAQRGVSVALMEMRAAGEPPVGRSNVVSARSMEAFRRLGIARAVRGCARVGSSFASKSRGPGACEACRTRGPPEIDRSRAHRRATTPREPRA